VVEQQHRFADFGVAHLDPVGKSRSPVDDVSLHAAPGQFFVGQPEQGHERVGRKSRNAERHGLLLCGGVQALTPPARRPARIPFPAHEFDNIALGVAGRAPKWEMDKNLDRQVVSRPLHPWMAASRRRPCRQAHD
jgi:hypothetical protein